MATNQPLPWEDDTHLKPVIEDDALLQFGTCNCVCVRACVCAYIGMIDVCVCGGVDIGYSSFTLVTDFEDLVSGEDTATPAAELTVDQYKVALSHALEELQIAK